MPNRSCVSLGREHRRRLVQDQDLDASVQRLQDLDALLLTDGEVLDRRASGSTLEPVLRPRARATVCSRVVDVEDGAALLAQDDVLGDGERVDQHEVLVDHADPERDRVARRRDLRLLPADEDPCRRRRDTSRTARASAWTCRRRSRRSARGPRRGGARGRHVVVREHAREPLRDVLEHDEGRGAVAPRPVVRSSSVPSPPAQASARPGRRSSPSMICCLNSSSCVDDVRRSARSVFDCRVVDARPRPCRRPGSRANVPSPTASIALYTAVSTRFSIEVRISGCCSGLAVRYWSESTPIASLSASTAALNSPAPDAPGGVVDDLGAVVVHRRWTAPRPCTGSLNARRVVADVLDEHLDVRVDRRRAGLVAGLELLDQRAGLAAEEPDRVALALERRRRADQERALVLLEGVVGHVRDRIGVVRRGRTRCRRSRTRPRS